MADFFRGKVDGNQQQLVFQAAHFGETFILHPTAISSEIGRWVGPKMPDPNDSNTSPGTGNRTL